MMSLNLMLASLFSNETDDSSRFKVEEGSPLMSDVASFLLDKIEGSHVWFGFLPRLKMNLLSTRVKINLSDDNQNNLQSH